MDDEWKGSKTLVGVGHRMPMAKLLKKAGLPNRLAFYRSSGFAAVVLYRESVELGVVDFNAVAEVKATLDGP